MPFCEIQIIKYFVKSLETGHFWENKVTLFKFWNSDCLGVKKTIKNQESKQIEDFITFLNNGLNKFDSLRN